MKPEVKVKVKIRDVEIELTLDEAVELGETLRKLGGAREAIYIPYYPSYPRPYWTSWIPWWSNTGGTYTVSYACQTGGNE